MATVEKKGSWDYSVKIPKSEEPDSWKASRKAITLTCEYVTKEFEYDSPDNVDCEAVGLEDMGDHWEVTVDFVGT